MACRSEVAVRIRATPEAGLRWPGGARHFGLRLGHQDVGLVPGLRQPTSGLLLGARFDLLAVSLSLGRRAAARVEGGSASSVSSFAARCWAWRNSRSACWRAWSACALADCPSQQRHLLFDLTAGLLRPRFGLRLLDGVRCGRRLGEAAQPRAGRPGRQGQGLSPDAPPRR